MHHRLAWWLILVSNAAAQPAEQPAFEVVSVRRTENADARIQKGPGHVDFATHPFRYTGNRVTCHLPLSSIIHEAYDVAAWQVQGPDWLETETYEFAATMPEGTSREAARVMLQSALAVRFGLKVHRGEKEIAILGLTAIPGSSKLQKADPGAETASYRVTINSLEAESGMRLRMLADILTRAAGRPVIDQTGLNGMYKVRLRWNADPIPAGNGSGPFVVRLGKDAGMLSAVSQIGLKLETQKKIYPVLVIDQVSKEPTGN